MTRKHLSVLVAVLVAIGIFVFAIQNPELFVIMVGISGALELGGWSLIRKLPPSTKRLIPKDMAVAEIAMLVLGLIAGAIYLFHR